jgi:hypothetical protein
MAVDDVVPAAIYDNTNMMALAAMAYSTDGSIGNGGHYHRLCSSS